MTDYIEVYNKDQSKYLRDFPDWHAADSPWKAEKVFALMQRNSLSPATIAEIGCGSGETLNQLYSKLPETTEFFGFDIAPDAIAIAKPKEKDRLHFTEENLLETSRHFDLLLMLDVFEHVEDYYGFLKKAKPLADRTIFAVPLEFSLRTLLKPTLISDSRKAFSHLHSFNWNTALLTLENCGYEVIDYQFASIALENKRIKSLSRRALYWLLYRLAGTRLTEDILGGHTLYVLAKPA